MFSIIVRYHAVTSPLSIPPDNGSFSPVTYTTVLLVTNDLWEGQSAFRVSITKVTPTIGFARVGTPSSVNVLSSCAGKLNS